MVRHKRRWSVIYEGDVGSAWEWCQIKLHTSCDVPAPLLLLVKLSNELCQIKTIEISLVRLAVVLCIAGDGV